MSYFIFKPIHPINPRATPPTLEDYPNVYSVDLSSGEHAFEEDDEAHNEQR